MLRRMTILSFIQAALTAYIVTLVIAESYAMQWLRELFREVVSEVAPWPVAKHFVRYDSTVDPLDTSPKMPEKVIVTDEKETAWEEGHDYDGYDFIGCRLCVGAWVSLSFIGWWIAPAWILPVWGAAWFLTRQER